MRFEGNTIYLGEKPHEYITLEGDIHAVIMGKSNALIKTNCRNWLLYDYKNFDRSVLYEYNEAITENFNPDYSFTVPRKQPYGWYVGYHVKLPSWGYCPVVTDSEQFFEVHIPSSPQSIYRNSTDNIEKYNPVVLVTRQIPADKVKEVDKLIEEG